MKIAITGASGFLGYHLIEGLLKQGHEVTALALDATTSHPLKQFNIEKHDLDIRDLEGHQKIFEGKDLVYHLASKIDITNKCRDELFLINVEGTKTVAQAALNAGVGKFIYTSSIHALTRYPLEGEIDESRPLALDDHFDYDRSKAYAEHALQEFTDRGLNTMIANLTGLWGPHDYIPSQMGLFLFQLMRQKYLMFACSGGFNFVDVRDAANTLIKMIDKGEKGQRYIIGGEWVHGKEIATVCNRSAGYRARLILLPLGFCKATLPLNQLLWKIFKKKDLYTEQSLVHLVSHRYISDQKARIELGHETRPVVETLTDLADWFKNL